MRVLSKRKLREFWKRHPDAEQPLAEWYKTVEKADWEAPYQVARTYRSVSIIPGNRLVFNIKGNRYRVVVKVVYEFRRVYVRFVGTHAEYNRIDAAEV